MALDADYTFKINGADYSDCVAMDGDKFEAFKLSAESGTGRTLDGRFHVSYIVTKRKHTINIPPIPVVRFRQLAQALRIDETGETVLNIQYSDIIIGNLVTKRFYCASINGTRKKLPDPPFHYVMEGSFSLEEF